MTLYQRKPLIVKAIQWTGKNVDEVLNFLKGTSHIAYKHSKDSMVINLFTKLGQQRVDINNYIIKEESFGVFREDEKEFKRKYEVYENSDESFEDEEELEESKIYFFENITKQDVKFLRDQH